MFISHDLLLTLGFAELPNRPKRYEYKGFTGRLNDDGSFRFHGFSPTIRQADDLKFLRMLIDHQQQIFSASSNN